MNNAQFGILLSDVENWCWVCFDLWRPTTYHIITTIVIVIVIEAIMERAVYPSISNRDLNATAGRCLYAFYTDQFWWLVISVVVASKHNMKIIRNSEFSSTTMSIWALETERQSQFVDILFSFHASFYYHVWVGPAAYFLNICTVTSCSIYLVLHWNAQNVRHHPW